MSRIPYKKLSFSKLSLKYNRKSLYWPTTPPTIVIWPIKQYKIVFLWCVILLSITVLLDSSMIQKSAFRQYFQTLRWTPLPVGIGFALIAFQQYRHTRRRESAKLGQCNTCDVLADEWEVQAYKLLPLRSFSRALGWLTGLELPEWSRTAVLGSYVKVFGCNMDEAEVEDVNKYRCLSELFRRRLKTTVRSIDPRSSIVSPADGTVLNVGKVNCGLLEQIKGVSYSAKRFLGPNCWNEGGPMVMQDNDDECFHSSCLHNPRKNDLYYLAIYLAPGDYHRFHSPADWEVSFRRHFPGELLSVNPAIASWIKDLFVLNERVCYVGKWDQGFISMTAVGATNVGSVIVPFDPELKTNQSWGHQPFFDSYFDSKQVLKKKGDDFGEFNLGSTIVLVFEAAKDTAFNIQPGDRVKMGQSVLK